MKKTFYSIVSTDPSKDGETQRVVESFDNIHDAEFVLKSLEKVNHYFNYYEIIKQMSKI